MKHNERARVAPLDLRALQSRTSGAFSRVRVDWRCALCSAQSRYILESSRPCKPSGLRTPPSRAVLRASFVVSGSMSRMGARLAPSTKNPWLSRRAGQVVVSEPQVDRGRAGADFAVTKVIVGGSLSSNKGVNVPDVVLPVPALTVKDRRDLDFALTLDVDWIALSFVQRPADVAEAKKIGQCCSFSFFDLR